MGKKREKRKGVDSWKERNTAGGRDEGQGEVRKEEEYLGGEDLKWK